MVWTLMQPLKTLSITKYMLHEKCNVHNVPEVSPE